MKDYLSSAKKSDDISEASENNEGTINANKEKITDADHVVGPEDGSRIDHENGSSGSKCLRDENELQKNCTLNSSAPLQQFKNVVAIVDPPRAGLHPTVSDVELYLGSNFVVSSLASISLILCLPQVTEEYNM